MLDEVIRAFGYKSQSGETEKIGMKQAKLGNNSADNADCLDECRINLLQRIDVQSSFTHRFMRSKDKRHN
jgi:hypothetical protein